MADVREAQLVTPAPVVADGLIEVRNPARSSEVVGTVPRLRPAGVDAVVGAAAGAQRAWARRSPEDRFADVAAVLLAVELEGLDVLLTREQGKVLSESTRELRYLGFPVRFLEAHLPWLRDGEDLGPVGTNRTRVFRDPVGVVGIISPWNMPVSMAVVTVAPALVAGNSVVLHVPVTAPLAAIQVFTRLAEALPPGVLSLITSDDTGVAAALVEHPAVGHVHFTGSTAVGSLVAAEGAATLTDLTLELGGNDAAVLLDDAFDLPDLVPGLVAGAFAVGGQACVAIKRLYVPRRRVGDVLDGLRGALDGWGVGDGLDPQVQLGPVHTAGARARLERLVASAAAEGGEVHELGTLRADPDDGHFVRPTLVTGLDNGATLVREEQFGPVLPIIGYDAEDDVVALANDSELGLGGSVWSADRDRAIALARDLRVGMTWINGHGGANIDGRAPWGGVGPSGIGRGGANRAGLEAFTEPHAVTFAD